MNYPSETSFHLIRSSFWHKKFYKKYIFPSFELNFNMKRERINNVLEDGTQQVYNNNSTSLLIHSKQFNCRSEAAAVPGRRVKGREGRKDKRMENI